MGLDNMIRVKYERRANILILLALLIYIKMSPVCAVPPDLASELTVKSITTTSATVRWGPNSVGTPPTFESYEVSITPSAGITFSPGPLVTATSANPETTISGLAAGVEYTVSVRTVSGTEKGTPKKVTFNAKPNPLSGSSAISFTNVASTKATVSWTAPSGTFAEYVISVNPAGATISSRSPIDAGTTFTNVFNLTPGTVYTVEMKTKSGESLSDPVTNTFTTEPEKVDAASLTVGNTATTTTATLTWGAVGTAFLTYEIAISPTTGGAKANPASVAKGTTTTALENLTPGTLYTISIKTKSATLESDAVTITFRTKPLSVSSIAIKDPTTTTATIAWNPLTLDPKYTAIYKYKVEIVPTGPTVSPSEVQHPGASTGVTGMTPGTRYKVKVTTIAGTGSHVAMSDPAEHEFTAKPTPVTQNSIVFENVATRTATAKWRKVSVGVFDEYKISINPTWPTINPNPVPGSTDPPRTALTNLVPGTQYTLTVITVSGTTESSPSSATFTAKPLPATGVTLTQNVDKMTITWSAGVGSIQSSYKIRYHAIFRNSTSAWTEETETALSKEISITPGEKYEVEVIAISGDQSSDATPANLVTAPLPPATVSVTKSAATITSIEVSWTSPTPASYFIKYLIKYTKEGATAPSQVEATPAERTKTISGLEAGVNYNVKVFTETKEGKRSKTSTDTDGTAKPNCDVVVTDMSTETNKLKASFTASTLVFTDYKFVILNGPKPAYTTLPKGTTTTELVYEQGVQPGTQYTIKASCVSNGVESDATDYFLASVPAPVTRVEPIIPGLHSVNMTIYKPEGTVSSVEISCSGPSNGPLNGCVFPKSRVFNGNTYNVTYDKLVPDEDYTFTIKAISNRKTSAPKVVTVKTTEGRSGPPSQFTASAQSPTSVKLEWKTPINPNGLIVSYVVEYTGTYKASAILNLPADHRKVTFDMDPNAGSYVKTIDGLKGGYQYDFALYGMTTYQGPGENAATSVTMPTAAPTLAADAVAPQGTGETDKTSITAIFSKAFNESNGPILYYSVIVAENKDDTRMLNKMEPDDTIHTWVQVRDIKSENWPPYMAIRHCDIFDTTKNCQGSPSKQRKKRSTTNMVMKIGIQDCKNKGKGDYCNGALKPDTYYQIRLRGHTGRDKYHDTYYSKRIPTASTTAAPDQAVAIGVSVTAVVILVIVIVVPVVVIVKRRKQQKGGENKQRPQAHVTVENSAFADIYDEITEPPQAPVKETAVMSMVTRYLPSADEKTRAKLEKIFAKLGVKAVKDLTYIKENDVVPPLTVIEARMFIEQVQEQEKKGSFDDVIYQEATVHPDQASAAVYVNVGEGLAVSGESAKSQTSEYASLQGFVKPDQNTYDQLGSVLRK